MTPTEMTWTKTEDGYECVTPLGTYTLVRNKSKKFQILVDGDEYGKPTTLGDAKDKIAMLHGERVAADNPTPKDDEPQVGPYTDSDGDEIVPEPTPLAPPEPTTSEPGPDEPDGIAQDAPGTLQTTPAVEMPSRVPESPPETLQRAFLEEHDVPHLGGNGGLNLPLSGRLSFGRDDAPGTLERVRFLRGVLWDARIPDVGGWRGVQPPAPRGVIRARAAG